MGTDDTSLAVTSVDRTPNLAKEFGRAVLTARGRPGGRGTLPRAGLEQRGVSVDRDLLVRYQRLCGYDVSDSLPATFPHLLGFPLQAQLMAAADFPLPLPGLVHIANRTTVHRALSATDTLDVRVHAENLRPHAKGSTVDLLASASIDGEVVWDSTSTYLHRGKPTGPVADRPKAPTLTAPRLSGVWRLPADLGRRYAAIAGDVNPIHLHPLTAKAMGFPRAIAHGMFTYARSLAAIGPRTMAPNTSRVWFAKPVLLPSSVALRLDAASTADRAVAELVAKKNPDKRHLTLEVDWS